MEVRDQPFLLRQGQSDAVHLQTLVRLRTILSYQHTYQESLISLCAYSFLRYSNKVTASISTEIFSIANTLSLVSRGEYLI